MSRSMRWVALGIVVTIVAAWGCRGRDEVLDRLSTTLAKCDDASACAKAVADLRSLDRERRDSPEGVEARLRALRLSIAALASFPEPDRPFLEGAGLEPERAIALLEEDARAIESLGARGAGSGDARVVLAALREPSCARLQALEGVEAGGGRFADVSHLVRLGIVAQVVGSVEAARVQAYSDVARLLLGCRMPAESGDAEVLVGARLHLEDLLASCPKGAGAVAQLGMSCERAAEIVKRPMPLPMPGLVSGELAGAMLPFGRGYGLSFTPPWVLVVAAGRLRVVDQPILAPGARKVPEPAPVELLDLRRSHRLEDVRTAVYLAWKDRPPVEVLRRKVFPLAVDRAETYADLMEVLEAVLSESDATPALALLPSGARNAYFLPINYRIANRPLMDPWGTRRTFVEKPPALDFDLNPFALTVRGPGFERSVEVMSPANVSGPRRLDLRGVYQLVLEAAGQGGERSARLAATSTVSVGLVTGLLEAVAARLDAAALASPGTFATAPALRGRNGDPSVLVPLVVIRAFDAPPD